MVRRQPGTVGSLTPPAPRAGTRPRSGRTASSALAFARKQGTMVKHRTAAVCALLQRGPITQRDEVRPATRSRQAAACTADRKSTRLNSSHVEISYAVFCLKKKK